MAIDQSDQAALQILLEDLDYLEDQQKGKRVSGKGTDWEIAMTSLREQILIAQTSARDEILAISMSTAVATDQNILASIQRDETHAAQDHQLALALSNGENPAHDMQERGENSDFEEDDAVSTVMCDLMSRIVVGEGSDNGEGPSNSSFSPRKSTVTKECCTCLEQFHSLMFAGSCGHEFCKDCIRTMFLGAIRDEELYPPRCCGQIVPPGVALRVLNYEELREFGARAVEWTAKDRLYCAEPTCSKFIPPYAIRNEIGTCSSCYQNTHLTCRSLEHPGVDCPMDEALQGVLEMAKGEDWRRCFHCQAMVELDHGCNHITCRCGREFCYVCGKVWHTCECSLWQENRLLNMANRAVEEEHPNANAVVRQNAFNRIVEGLQNHEEVGCEHHRNSQWAWRNSGSLECELCFHDLPEYIFMCRNCRIRVCNRCRRHRIR